MDYVHEIDEAETRRIRRFLYWTAASTVAFVLFVFGAFVTADSWLLHISTDSERRFIDPYLELADGSLLRPGEEELQGYVQRVADKMVAQMDVPEEIELSFRVIEGETVNAFTTLGGYVFVTEGLVQALHSENSLAMVLGHEIAHARQRDPLLGIGRGMLVGLLISSLSGSGGNPASLGDLGSQLVLNVYSREQEEVADDLALAGLYAVYGHVGGATELFEVVGEEPDPAESLGALATHPKLVDRIDYLTGTAAAQGWPQQAVEPYPARVVELLKQL